MPLTLEEMEREAVQLGDSERAALLRLAIDKQDEEGLAEELAYAEEEAEEAKMQMWDLCDKVGELLLKLEQAVEDGDKEAALVFIEAIREEL